jgi:hypothetical protein
MKRKNSNPLKNPDFECFYVEGNPFADYLLSESIDKEYLAWALLQYMVNRNIINFCRF